MTVRVEDGQGGSNTIEITINLTDVREPPETPDPPSVSAASSTSLTVTWTEPTNTGSDINDYDIQYREGDSGGFTPWTHNSAERTATITNLTPRTRYEVQVKARNDEGASDWSPSGTGSTGANGRPVFTDGSSATRALDENTTGVQDVGDPVSATDPENTTLTYSLEGTDADAFTINSRSGQLRTKSDQTYDHETTPRYVVSVKATDGHSGEGAILVLINLNDVNEPPAFTSDATFETVENGTRVGAVIARDEDSADDITNYTITGGADRDLLEIDSGGALTFKNAPDFEDPKDSGRNNQYSVAVTATGGTGGRALTAQQTITVTVTDVNEPPVFTSDDAFKVKENQQIVGRVTAQDADRNDGITGYEVTGGADGSRFEIAGTNQLRFKDDPDFERPADAGGNNENIVEVTATGGAGTREMTGTQTITVTVEDVDEPPGKPDPPTVSDETESSLTVTWTEPANTGPRHHQLPCTIPRQRRVYRLAGHRPVPDPHDHRLEFGQHLPDPGTGGERRREGRVVQFGQRDHAPDRWHLRPHRAGARRDRGASPRKQLRRRDRGPPGRDYRPHVDFQGHLSTTGGRFFRADRLARALPE